MAFPTINFDTFRAYIDGNAVTSGEYSQALNPVNEIALWPVPSVQPSHVDETVRAARKAFESWSRTTQDDRRQAMHAYANTIEHYAQEFTKCLRTETGKPVPDAGIEIKGAVSWIRQNAELVLSEQVLEENSDSKTVLRYVPVGVVGGIVPWNFPMMLAAAKIAPAVMAGNVIIIKPSPFAPYSTLKLVEVAQHFFPPGVVQSICGDDSLGPILTANPQVDKISFTGSTPTGKAIYRSCAGTLKRLTLELGGNDPAIIFDDVDIEQVAPVLVSHAFRNSGQVCRCVKRIYIQSSIYDSFLQAMVHHTKLLSSNQDEDTALGPLQNKMQFDRVGTYFQDISTQNWKVAVGGARSSKKGYYFEPTIIDNPPDDSRIVVEEQFGPIVPTLSFENEEEVVRRANDTRLGLGASVWTKDPKRASRVAKQIEAGSVWINRHAVGSPTVPLAGHKESGIGVEWGLAGLKDMCNVQVVAFDKTI